MPVTRLPLIYGGGPTAQADPRMTLFAREFTVLWMQALPDDRRELMRQDDRLIIAAQLHSEYLASRTPAEIAERANVDHASHYGRDWSTANERVRAQGYRLPGNYPFQGNHVESNARDGNGPLAALEGLLHSDAHRPHLLGEPGFSDRVVYGIGQAGADYCVLACPKEMP